MSSIQSVYLIVHELFGIVFRNEKILLVTPDVSACNHPHTYKIGRFKDGAWLADKTMTQGRTYRLTGVAKGGIKASNTPPHPEYNAHPPGNFALTGTPYCQWDLYPPKEIHQLRLLSIPLRPLFTGREGNAVEQQIMAIALVQALEYDPDPASKLQIVDDQGNPVTLDYSPDVVTNTVNLHIWAEIEDESGMNDDMATKHSMCATKALKDLFKGLDMNGQQSLATDNWYSSQLPMPDGLRFVELLTLGERFALRHTKGQFQVLCTPKTCGHGSNFFVNG